LATSGDTAARITSIQAPDQIAAHRVRPPALTFSAVWPTEPPTGRPRKNPDTRLPAPWATMSVSGCGWPSGFGAASATPAPWTNTIAATASAPVTRLNDTRLKSGGVLRRTRRRRLDFYRAICHTKSAPATEAVGTGWSPGTGLRGTAA
jgi:hypothetical protein